MTAPVPAVPGALAHLPKSCGWQTPMQSRAWLQACYEVLYPRDTPWPVEVEGGVGPFVRRRGLLPVLYLAGAEELAEAIEPPVATPGAAERLAGRLLAARRPVRFGHIPAEGAFTRAFLVAAVGRGIVLQAPAGGSPVLWLDASWTDPLARFSSRRRSDVRRMQRRAEAMGAVRVEILSPDPAEVPELLEAAFAVEARGWKARNRTAIAQTPDQAAFLRRYGALTAAEGRFRIAFLRIGDEIAAMQIMVEEDGALWLLKIGYDEDFAKASPGMLLLLEVIRAAAAQGLERVEFLGKASDWTAFWTRDLRPHIRLRYYPRNLAGLAALVRDGGVLALRRGRRRLRSRISGVQG